MSEKRMIYAEDVIQRIRDLAPEILGGWYNPDMENELEQLVCVVENTPTAAAQDAQRWRNTAEEPPKEEDGDCCGRVLIAHAGAHCAVATSLQYARENPEAVPRLDATPETTVGGRKMSKAVLLSIRPEWCKKILDGEKPSSCAGLAQYMERRLRCTSTAPWRRVKRLFWMTATGMCRRGAAAGLTRGAASLASSSAKK